MRKHIDYRLSAALLSLTVLGGSATRGEESVNRDVFGLDYELVEQSDAKRQISLDDFNFLDHLHGLVQAAITSESRPTPLAFDFALPLGRSGDSMLMLCGHLCDGDRCYVTDDAAEKPAVAAELAADAKQDLSFRIETREAAPPMPMLRTKQTASANADQAAPAHCELGSPSEATAPQAIPSYGPEMLEVVRLRCELDAARQLLESERGHHEQRVELLTELGEAKAEAAAFAATHEVIGQFIENSTRSAEEKSELAAMVASLQAGGEAVHKIHEFELEATRLKAELVAAKEWISQRVAAEQAAMPPYVSYPYPQPLIVPPSMIPAPLTVYEPQFVATGAQPLSTVRPPLAHPVPFAFGSYVPQEPGTTCPACPASASNGTICDATACNATVCNGTVCNETACNQGAGNLATCSDAASGGCSKEANTAVCSTTACKTGDQLASVAGTSAACDCEGCDSDACVCTGCGCSDQGVCGCVVACPKSACPKSETADANVASRGNETEPAESR